MTLLTVDGVRVEFGGIVALADLSFTIDEGQICALIGPNGAGKTTLFNCVSRLYQPKEGRIEFDGHDLLALPAHRIARAGIARTFQNLALFPALTVAQNVMVGAHSRADRRERAAPKRSSCSSGSGSPTSPTIPAVGLPYGTLKRVEIARALAARPDCCCSTSPRPGSRTPRSTSSPTSCARSATSSSSACCSWSTTWRW